MKEISMVIEKRILYSYVCDVYVCLTRTKARGKLIKVWYTSTVIHGGKYLIYDNLS